MQSSPLLNQRQFTAVVPAAGTGTRMAADRPKQYLMLGNMTVLEHTLTRLISHPHIARIIVVTGPEDHYFAQLKVAQEPWLQRVTGGEERADSVLNGLKACKENWVLVHDAARPCVRHSDISRLLQLAAGEHGGILAKQATDTIKLASEKQCSGFSTVQESLPRNRIWQALTPQFFPRQQLIDAMQWCVAQNIAVTDEASAIENASGKVHLVPGAHDNIKITHPGDLSLAQFLLEQQVHNQQE